MSVLPIRMSIHHIHAWCLPQLTWNWSYRHLQAITWVPGIKPGLSRRAAMLFNTESSPWSYSENFMHKHCIYISYLFPPHLGPSHTLSPKFTFPYLIIIVICYKY